MTKKRFAKLCMAMGCQRNEAAQAARDYNEDGCTYEEAIKYEGALRVADVFTDWERWDHLTPELRKLYQPEHQVVPLGKHAGKANAAFARELALFGSIDEVHTWGGGCHG